MGQMWSESFPPKTKFTAETVPDLTGKVVIVTGGNTGIGKETIKALLKKNAKVYMASRNKQKAEEAIADLKRETGKEAIFLELDLADLRSIKNTVHTFQSQEQHLHILFNSGGVMVPPVDQLTKDGYDLQFGTNVLGHYYFTILLLPTLIETARSVPEGKVRVVNTSSSAHLFASSINYETVVGKNAAARKKLGTQRLYAQSKFANVVFSNELARRYADQGIVSTALNPGNIKTDLQRHVAGFLRTLMNAILHPVELGAVTQLYAGTAPEAIDYNGKYLIPWARVGEARKETRDAKAGEELWKWLEAQVEPLEAPVPN